jgi:outer membrane protein OmpA-like peptidoglycan-associated protein
MENTVGLRSGGFRTRGPNHLSAVALMALCFSFADMALAQTTTAYSKEGMEQALATKHHYDLYGIHFDFDKAVIQPDSNALLDDIATTLKHFPSCGLM